MNRPFPIPTAPSRRAFLAVAAAGAASAVAPAAAAEVDPIFALIAEHRAAIEAFNQLVEVEGDTRPADDYADDLLFEVLTTQPTSLAGVVAVLAHLGQPQFLDEYEDYVDFNGRQTLLSWLSDATDEEMTRLGREFPLRLAETLRGLIDGR